MELTAPRALYHDVVCLVVFVVIGTRNHDTDTGFTGVLTVAAPFLVALVLAHLAFRSFPRSAPTTGLAVASTTVAIGMILRNLVWDRSTAMAFIIVAVVFNMVTMVGWRAWVARRGIKPLAKRFES